MQPLVKILVSRIQMEPWPSGEELHPEPVIKLQGGASRDYRLSAAFESRDT